VRLTLRMLVCPFGPVVVDWTLPPPRMVERVAVLPFGPVTVEVLLGAGARLPKEIGGTDAVRDVLRRHGLQ